MQKRHLLVGLVMLAASVVSYELATLGEARPAVEIVDAVGSAVAAKSIATPQVVIPSQGPEILSFVDSVPDTAVLLATGATLLAIAAGMRRRIS